MPARTPWDNGRQPCPSSQPQTSAQKNILNANAAPHCRSPFQSDLRSIDKSIETGYDGLIAMTKKLVIRRAGALSSKRRSIGVSAFTLIELLVVIAVIAIL